MENLIWFKIAFTIKNSRFNEKFTDEPNVSVINSIIKWVSTKSESNTPVFRLETKYYSAKSFKNETIKVELVLYDHATKIERWVQELKKYFNQKDKRINFYLADEPDVQIRSLNHLYKEYEMICNSNQFCLHFHSPLPLFEKTRDKYVYKTLISGAVTRLNRIFKIDLNREDFKAIEEIEVNSNFQYYTRGQIHTSKSSNSKQKQWLKGFVGPLYIRGKCDAIVPILLLATEWHLGPQISNSMGYFTLSNESIPSDKKMNEI